MELSKVQYVSDEAGGPTGVIVPIDLWRKIEAAAQGDVPPRKKTTRRPPNSEDAADLRAARRARREAEAHGTISWADIKRELGL